MKHIYIFLAAIVFFIITTSSYAETLVVKDEYIDPLNLYGDEIYFYVYRDSKKVGFHQTLFEKKSGTLIVTTTFELKINIIFFTAYQYLYNSIGLWEEGHIRNLKAKVDDDGDLSSISVSQSGSNLIISNKDGRINVKAPLIPTNHWNVHVLDQDRVLNTLTGRINNVKIIPKGRESVMTERGSVIATHYVYSGDLDTEVWYDDKGRWVKLRFKAEDGSVIDYRCQKCQGANIE